MVITEAHWESQWNMNDMWTRGFERLKKSSLLFYFLQEYLMGNKYQCFFNLADILWFAAAGAAVQSRVSAVLFFLHFPCTSAVCFRVYSHVFPSFVASFFAYMQAHAHDAQNIALSMDDRQSFLCWFSSAAFFCGHEEERDTGRGSTAFPSFCVQRTACSMIALKSSTARHIDAARGERRFFSAVGARDCAFARELALLRVCVSSVDVRWR
ncbi:hypothetical protein Tc00.1047053509427.80 [Trypanosoma cruzi]|uniref:Uncharacterized protein n=1 Tax=Trypanosoma cruzi (strain CL Brener) TaxID=353153 RepID=Q4D6S0_TRYCC|nr:hypothetical protein Tc00.1047053509427.80 [Trypanosoma cruzi]EAN88222.1 hypothetical protein Tc00.1047053509427.80 [Trypanosoma cruzi]|eukprot:XP_810073.1 hypothetical protein [Trypanosoma cruzi strain CL Brener]